MKKINYEYILLIVFIGTFIYAGLSLNWDKKLAHEYPRQYSASDAYFHQSVADYALQQGQYHIAAPYLVGGHVDSINQHPPGLFEVTIAISYLTGLETYDSTYLVTFIFALLAVLSFYMIWRQISIGAAMLSIPVTVLVFKSDFIVWLTWGFWMFVAGIAFMIASLWVITKLDLKKSYILFGLLLGGTYLTHPPQAVFVLLFLGIYIIAKLIKNRKLEFSLVKTIFLTGIISLILSLYFILIFSKTMLNIEGFRNVWTFELARAGIPVIVSSTLGYIGLIALAGLIIFLISKHSGGNYIAASIPLFMFLLGYLIWVGFGKRAYTHRLFWYFYLAFFFGYAIYFIISLLNKLVKNPYPKPTVCVTSIVLLLLFAQPLSGILGQDMLTADTWNALQWIKENVPDDSLVYYFWSDVLSSKAILYSTEHVSFFISRSRYVTAINTNQIYRNYTFGIAKGYRIHLKEEIPFLSYCYYPNLFDLSRVDPNYGCTLKEFEETDIQPPEEFRTPNICDIEYYHFDKFSFQPVLAQYNLAIRELLLKNEWIEEVYSNQLVSILKNNRPGDECFENIA